jgi:hypothetical protein
MFDDKANLHAELLSKIGSSYYKHIVAVISLDTSAIGWAPGGGGGEAGRFDYEGNGLLFLPSFLRANDLSKHLTFGEQHGLGQGFHLYAFMNSKDNPGIPMRVNAEAQFGDFVGVCMNFNRFYLYIDQTQGFAQPSAQLAVLKGVDFFGMGSDVKASTAEIHGCYGA